MRVRARVTRTTGVPWASSRMSPGRTRRAVVTMSVSAGAVVSVLMIPPGYGVGVLTCVPRSGVAPGAPTRVERGTRGRPGGLPKPGRLGNSVERHRADAAVDSLVRALVRAVVVVVDADAVRQHLPDGGAEVRQVDQDDPLADLVVRSHV